MADYAVIYDEALELAAIVDTDTMRATGPVGAGPNARAELEQFVNSMPPTFLEAGSYDLCRAWAEYWSREFQALYKPPAASAAAAVVEPTHTGDDADSLAVREAVAAGDGPPEPQPADTDMGAIESTPIQVIACVACNGTGRVPGATEGEQLVCNLCQGTGKIAQPVLA